MRVFVYEFITGGGLLSTGEGPPRGSLLREGAAMLSALAADFLRIEGVSVDVLRDARLADFELPQCRAWQVCKREEELGLLRRLSAEADATVLIAPESNGSLARRVQIAEEAKANLLSPGAAFVEIASDKNRTADYLHARGIPVPQGAALLPGENLPADFPAPFVCKPARGAGSQGVSLFQNADDWRPTAHAATQRIEAYCHGTPVSCAWIGGAGVHLLEPCLQRLRANENFAYQGGQLPLADGLRRRARALAQRVANAFPPTTGYVGVDMVLGTSAPGRNNASEKTALQDVVLEVNPRLTTSYVGLRAACRGNLAEAMLQAKAGQAPCIEFTPDGWEFDAYGHVARLQAEARK